MHRSEACVGGVAAVLMREVALTDINWLLEQAQEYVSRQLHLRNRSTVGVHFCPPWYILHSVPP